MQPEITVVNFGCISSYSCFTTGAKPKPTHTLHVTCYAVFHVNLRCTWCGESHCLGECIANGQKWKCKGCYSTERWLQSSYKSTNRSHQWTSMSMDERRQEILKNRSSHGQRGAKRQFVAREEANVVDSVGSRASTPYLNEVQRLLCRYVLQSSRIIRKPNQRHQA